MGKRKTEFVLDGAFVKCSMGLSPSTLKVTLNHAVYGDGKKVATKMDVVLNPPTFGICKPFSSTPAAACTYLPKPPWSKPHNKQKFIGIQPLLSGSTLRCMRPGALGKITIVDNMQFLSSKYNIDPKELLCPKCNKLLSNKDHKCEGIPPGDYEGDGGKLGDCVLKRKKGGILHYKGKFSEHPFYVKNPEIKDPNSRNGIEAHHLLSSSSVRKMEKYAALIKMLGYSINHRNNGLLIPTIMEVACAYAVPLHNGGHAATFVLNKNTFEDIETIKKWSFNPIKEEKMKVIFPSYNPENELIQLNYEDHIIEIVKNICETYIIDDVCNIEERKNIAKDFIVDMDKNSQVVFKKISTFSWILTSDGFDYAPGRIGCCGCDTLKDKRIKIKESLKSEELPSAESNVKRFWGKILSSQNIIDKINKMNYICKAGANTESHLKNNASAFYQERANVEEFKGFE